MNLTPFDVNRDHVLILRRHSRAMEPIETGVSPVIGPVGDIRAVLFDVYGTMLISGSGDIGTTTASPADAFSEACGAVGARLRVAADVGGDLLIAAIRARHAAARSRGIDFPEVDIGDIWVEVLGDLRKRDWLECDEPIDPCRLAIEYEVRVNPAWPMPGLRDCLRRLSRGGRRLGIISNAQFFTPLLFPALLDQSPSALGFSASLSFYSYRYEQAKPGSYLFERARESLESLEIAPGEALYIGNDMLNDVMPAARLGFKTVLFAGDRRSLRTRDDDERVSGVEPDITITHLDQIAELLDTSGGRREEDDTHRT